MGSNSTVDIHSFRISHLIGQGGGFAKVCLAYRGGVCYALKYLKKDAKHER